MKLFLLSLLPASLWIYSVNILFSEGHLLEVPGSFLRHHLNKKIAKPLFDCAICMASFWGLVWVAIGLPFSFHIYHDWTLWVQYCFCLCGFNVIINKLISKERVIIEE